MVENPDDDAAGQGEMVLLAALVSRVEALVVGSMLEAAGIFVHIDGLHHASVSVNSVALGGHRIRVPDYQHKEASEILLEVLGDDEWGFSYGLRRAVLRVMALWSVPYIIAIVFFVMVGKASLFAVLLSPLSALSLPVNPQGRGDYFLAEEFAG